MIKSYKIILSIVKEVFGALYVHQYGCHLSVLVVLVVFADDSTLLWK